MAVPACFFVFCIFYVRQEIILFKEVGNCHVFAINPVSLCSINPAVSGRPAARRKDGCLRLSGRTISVSWEVLVPHISTGITHAFYHYRNPKYHLKEVPHNLNGLLYLLRDYHRTLPLLPTLYHFNTLQPALTHGTLWVLPLILSHYT